MDVNFASTLRENPVFDIISASLEALGQEGYVIGGWVRDLLLGSPSKDIDVVTVGSGIALAQEVAKRLGPNTQVNVFKNFGTAMVKYAGGDVEFVGARKESYNRDSRKPVVEDGTLEDDQNRRDFTINAMALGLNPHNYGQLLDPFNGQQDLKKGIIRTPLAPDITFSDDPLRMLRAIRFAGRLNFDIHPDTFQAIIEQAERISIVSQERITDELNKMILAKSPGYGFKLLFASGLLARIFPEMQALHGVEKVNGMAHKDNFYHTLKVLDNVAKVSPDLWLRWSAILHDIAKPPTKRFHPKHGWTFHGHEDKGARMVPGIFRRMKLPMGGPMRFVQKLVRLHLRPIALVKKDITDSAIRRVLFEAGPDIDALMILCRADITSKNHERVKRYLHNFDRVEAKMKEVEEKDALRNFQPPVSGQDIMQAFGIGPSPVIGHIKEAIKEAILEGHINNDPAQAYALMLKLGQEKGLVPAKAPQKANAG